MDDVWVVRIVRAARHARMCAVAVVVALGLGACSGPGHGLEQVAGEWSLVALSTQDGPVEVQGEPRLTITEDGTASGNDGVSPFTGRVVGPPVRFGLSDVSLGGGGVTKDSPAAETAQLLDELFIVDGPADLTVMGEEMWLTGDGVTARWVRQG